MGRESADRLNSLILDDMQRKLPLLTADNRDFWTGGAVRELRIYFCRSCSRLFHPPAPLCPRCASFDVYAKVVSGTGRILTFTINYQVWVPGLQTPYAVAIVELDEDTDIRFVSNVIGIQVEDAYIGMPVRAVYEQHEDVWLPLFEPAS